MTFIIAYWAFLMTTLGVSWAIGPADTRRGIAMIIFATFSTAVAQSALGRTAAPATILAIDALLLAHFVALALRSINFWPMWFAALCGVGVLSSATALLFPGADVGLYLNYAGFWAIPALLVLLVGTILDSRAGIDDEFRAESMSR